MMLMNRGRLSAEAKIRLASVMGDQPVPDLTDPRTVKAWRTAQNLAWGEDLADGERPHGNEVIGGVRCLTAGTGPTLIYLHGGGFCLGSPGTAIPITNRLAARTRVVSVDYRLAPEHPFPSALDDASAVVAAEVARSAGPVFIGGDSAGGNLAVSTALRAPELIAGLVLFCPLLDLRAGALPASPMTDVYVGDTNRSHPAISILAAPTLSKLPPTLLQTTTTEEMYSQALDYADRCPATVLQVWEGLWHAWHYHRELPEAWEAVDHASAWVIEHS